MGASRRPPKNKEPWQLAENQGSRPGRPSHILLAQTGAARSGSILTCFVCVVEGKLRNDERRWLPDDAPLRSHMRLDGRDALLSAPLFDRVAARQKAAGLGRERRAS